ncbi:MAG: RNA methyltransferase [Deltaproteobacteria bacterium]|nr:RNA methyltransferase [Deltaproteobacteria bacterium]
MHWKSLTAAIERSSTPRGREVSGLFAVEGFRLIERALAAGLAIESAVFGASLTSREDERARRLLERLEAAGVELVEAPDEALLKATGGRETGALAALIRLPGPRELREVLPAAGPCRVLVAVGVDDPGNLGALARTALAGGADAFVITGVGDPYHPRAVRISRGSLFRIPVIRFDAPEQLLEALEASEVETLAAVTTGGRPLDEVVPPADARWAICMGSEAFGLPETLVPSMDHAVSIPMAEGVDSYSVHAAAAILLYALRAR